MQKINLKGQLGLNQLAPLALTIIMAGIVIAYGLQMQGDVKNDFADDSLEYNATENAQTAAAKIPAKMPSLTNIALAILILGMIALGFGKFIGLY